MIFQSRGCQTCRKRRVRCDNEHPNCTRCQKATLICTWDPDDGTIVFKTENALPQRTKTRWRDSSTINLEQAYGRNIMPGIVIPKSLTEPIENQAINYWAAEFTKWPSDLTNIGLEYGGFANIHANQFESQPSFRLPLVAYSLKLFGRAMRSAPVLEMANDCYMQGVIGIRKEISDISSVSIDLLLIATMLMGSNENLGPNFRNADAQHIASKPRTAQISLNWHVKGAASLIRLRQQLGRVQDILLERTMRRIIIRACLMSSEPVQDWLRDGALYGEEGVLLDLDTLIVQAASLQSRCSRSTENGSTGVYAIQTLAEEAIDLDTRLAVWAKNLPEHWTVCSQDHAVIWMRYCAIRVILNDWLIRLHFFSLGSISGHTLQLGGIAAFDQNIAALAAYICFSSRAFFQTPEPAWRSNMAGGSGVLKIEARMAAVLTWPLALALKSTFLGEEHRLCMSGMMDAVKRALGATAPA